MAEEKKVNEAEKKASSENLGMQTIIAAQALNGTGTAAAAEQGAVRVVGLQSSKKKDGSGYAYNLYFEEAYSEYDKQRGVCIGVKTSSVYIRDESKIPRDLQLGDHVRIYSVQRGNFVAVDEIRIIGR